MTSEDVLAAACKLARKWFKDNDEALRRHGIIEAYEADDPVVSMRLKAAILYGLDAKILCTRDCCPCPACIVREAEGLARDESYTPVRYDFRNHHTTCSCDQCKGRVEAEGLEGNAQLRRIAVCGRCPWCKKGRFCYAKDGTFRCSVCRHVATAAGLEGEGEKLVGNSGMPTPPGYGPDQVESGGAAKPRGACSDTACPRYGRCPYQEAKLRGDPY